MATKFIEPGGDATFNVALTSAGGFWDTIATYDVALPSLDSTIANTNHKRSILIPTYSYLGKTGSQVADTGSRISFYIYFQSLATSYIFSTTKSTGAGVFSLMVRNSGVLVLRDNALGTDISSDSTLAMVAGKWYRVSVAYTITSTTVNRFEVFINGSSQISLTNATLTNTSSSRFYLGDHGADPTVISNVSDIYVDDSSSLADPGNIFITAKRPISNGTLNEFTTQIGTGSSGYGYGHAIQVNERALSNTNGWSMQNAAKKTEEYTIEGTGAGDTDISLATIVDFVGWVDCKVGVNSTGNIIVVGVATNISVTTSEGMFTKVVGSTTYPTGNTDIGMDTNTVNQLFSLYECGIMVAYIPSTITEVKQTVNSNVISGLAVNNIQSSYIVPNSLSPSPGTTQTLDLSLSNRHVVNFSKGNLTLAISNATVGQSFIVELVQDSVGSRTVTWFSTIKWSGGTSPTLTTTASKKDSFGFIVTGTGTYDGYIIGQNV